jgi:hypothetical protein
MIYFEHIFVQSLNARDAFYFTKPLKKRTLFSVGQRIALAAGESITRKNAVRSFFPNCPKEFTSKAPKRFSVQNKMFIFFHMKYF